jgi:hypothetical protein
MQRLAIEKGAILVLSALLLALMLGSQQLIAQQFTEAYMVHGYITVEAKDLKRYEFYVCGGCRVAIIFYVYDPSWKPADIIFRALDPEGREIYTRSKVVTLQWNFTARRAGIYVLEFDNTYSILTGKYVDLALAVRAPSTTITEYRVATEYRTLTIPTTEYRTLTETLTITPSILSQESMLILTLVATVAFIVGILLTLLARRS